MRTFLAAAVLALFLAPAAFAGNAGDSPQQQMAPQTKVVVVQPDNGGDDNNWAVPAIVAAIGAAGVVGAAYVSKRKAD
jgi:hypothetical protein